MCLEATLRHLTFLLRKQGFVLREENMKLHAQMKTICFPKLRESFGWFTGSKQTFGRLNATKFPHHLHETRWVVNGH